MNEMIKITTLLGFVIMVLGITYYTGWSFVQNGNTSVGIVGGIVIFEGVERIKKILDGM